ncbi:hypothetical protein BDZ97DRAFT_1766774 [Flammula alnicola]|nr:hypothetical protein BDZ97DRAFT_1766774 [Flammula alnicola]
MSLWRIRGYISLRLTVHSPIPHHPTSRTITDSSTLNHTTSGKYIVVFKDGVTSEQITKYADEVKATDGEIKQAYDEDGRGILNVGLFLLRDQEEVLALKICLIGFLCHYHGFFPPEPSKFGIARRCH